jgi:superfamily II DNA or RNA helicase
MKLRTYQTKAVGATERHWDAGVRSVLLVAPAGAGKTMIGAELARHDERVLWVAHRRELVLQARDRLVQLFGGDQVGVIMPGVEERPRARIQLGTVQTLAFREKLPRAGLLVLDEAHHYVAEEWQTLVTRCEKLRTAGLTATPQRGDGTPLGDIFDKLVPVASYSALIKEGHLVPAAILQPPEDLGNDLALDPFEAWTKYSGGALSFVCCARVSIALALAQKFRDHGVIASTITAETPTRERDEMLAKFRGGKVRVLTYVDTLTEGVDVPEAACIILAKQFGTVGAYIQTAGRGGRPAPGKTHMMLVDLTGASLRHGSPTMDRIYSLEGRPISGEGHPHEGGGGQPAFEQEVKGLELQASGWQPSAMAEPVPVKRADEGERKAEFFRLRDMARKHRMRDGFAAAKFHEKFGEWPRSDWT